MHLKSVYESLADANITERPDKLFRQEVRVMMVRKARVRDAASIVELLPDNEKISVDEMIGMICDTASKVFVAVDFSSNMMGCSLGEDKIFISETSKEFGIEDSLKGQYM